eukprot:5551701-Prymnesium_polylepis.1
MPGIAAAQDARRRRRRRRRITADRKPRAQAQPSDAPRGISLAARTFRVGIARNGPSDPRCRSSVRACRVRVVGVMLEDVCTSVLTNRERECVSEPCEPCDRWLRANLARGIRQCAGTGGLWPMVRRVAVASATYARSAMPLARGRALGVVERTNG